MKQSSQYPVDFNGPFLGLNTASAPHMLGPGFAREAENVIISRGGSIRPRDPWAKYWTAPPADWIQRQVIGMLHLDVSKLVAYSGDGPAVRVLEKHIHPDWDGGQVHLIASASADAVQITSQASKLPPTWILALGRLFIIDGGGPGNPALWQYNGNKTFSLGIPAPLLTSQVSFVTQAGGGGPEQGTYIYGVTFYDSIYARESNAVLSAVQSFNGNTRMTVIEESGVTDDGFASLHDFDKLRIYRKHTHDADGNELGLPYRLIGEYSIGSGGTWDNDVYDDDELTLSDEATGPFMPTRNGVPPNARVAEWYKRRMWYADPDDGTKLWYSEIDQPDHVYALSFLPIGGDPDDIITGMVEMAGQLVILKKNSIWILSGDLETYTNDLVALGAIPGTDFFEQFPEVYKTKSKTGCHNSGGGNGAIVCGHPPLLYYSRADGLYVFDGVDDRPVSDLVRAEWEEMLSAVNETAETDHAITYAVDLENQILYVAPSIATSELLGTVPGNPGTSMVMAYHWGHNRGDGVGLWTVLRCEDAQAVGCVASCLGKPYHVSGSGYNTVERIEQQSALLVAVLAQNQSWFDSRILFADPVSGTGRYFPPWKWRTGDLPLNGSKKVHVYYLEQRHAKAASMVLIEYSPDGDPLDRLSPSEVGEDTLSSIVRRKRVGRTARTFALQFSKGTAAVPFVPWDGITGFALDVELAEQR